MSNSGLIKLVFIITILLQTGFGATAQELSEDETELYNLVMQYRKDKGLPSIPLSKSLTLVAQTHANDLEENYTPGEKCNIHSWSGQGSWKQVCYTKDHAQRKLMWSKPRELTTYKGDGFEIAFSEDLEFLANAESALDSWKLSKAHNDVILNKGIWKKKWNAIGVAIVGSYAVMWFGYVTDN